MRKIRFIVVAHFLAAAASSAAFAQRVVPPSSYGYDSTVFAGLKWREIGPYRGGRSVAVAASSTLPHESYFCTTGGGVCQPAHNGAHRGGPTGKTLAARDAAVGTRP